MEASYGFPNSPKSIPPPSSNQSTIVVDLEREEYATDISERSRSVGERLNPTLAIARSEQAKYAHRARLAGIAVSGAMFAQIGINALVTILSVALNNRHAQIGVSALGGIGTVLASFLLRMRGTQEPDRSSTHARNLEKYIQELEAFIHDNGSNTSRKWDPKVNEFRMRFEKVQAAVHQVENGLPATRA